MQTYWNTGSGSGEQNKKERNLYSRLGQPEDGQYRPKHVVVHYIVIKHKSCDTVVFDCLPFSKFHTHTTGTTQFLDSQVSGRVSKAGPSKYETEMLSCRFGC